LGIELIFAHSPQAKGRIERVFKTLQDRLVKELRLASIDTLEDANLLLKTYLPVFNKKFEVLAKATGDFHRSLDQRIDIEEILSIQTERFLRNDRTVQHNSQWYQVLSKTRVQRVMVYEYLDGQIGLKHGKTKFNFKPIEPPAPKVYQPVVSRFKSRPRKSPAANSAWRMFKLPGSYIPKTGHF
jgi:hypothetical protein